MASKEVDPTTDIPDVDSAERREVRRGYRDLQSDALKHRHDYVQPGNEGLISILDNAHRLSKKVMAPAEAVLDSNLLKNVAAMGVEQARNLNTSRISFDMQDMAKKCVRIMRGARGFADDDSDEDGPMRQRLNLDWRKLEDVCAPCLTSRAPVATFMYGPMALKPKERKQAQKRQVDKTSEKQSPENVQSANQYQETTTEEVARIAKCLRETLDANPDYKAVPYFEFVLNPASFSQSVENIFHTAFLVKDSVAYIEFDGDEPFIGLTATTGADNSDTVRQQFIVEMDQALYEDLVDVFQLKEQEPCIPTRPEPAEASQARL